MTVLVLRALGLGDLLTAVPALRALRRHFPSQEIVLAGPERLADPLRFLGCVDRLLPTNAPGREVPERLDWSGPAPDVAVDLHGNGPLSREPLERLRPGLLVAWASEGHDGPKWAADEHERERWCRLLRSHGVSASADDLLLDAEPGSRSESVLIHPGADAGSRRWPAERFAAVAAGLREAGVPVVLTAGRGERPLALSVASRAGLPESAVLGGDGDLPFAELVETVRAARAVVVGDTGIAHLASAFATPSVVLFGPVSPALWGPPDHPRHRVLWRPDDPADLRPGDAHGSQPDERLLRIHPDDVLAALSGLGVPVLAAAR
jgi:ADP-heptose:LPS heptosyltransferase